MFLQEQQAQKQKQSSGMPSSHGCTTVHSYFVCKLIKKTFQLCLRLARKRGASCQDLLAHHVGNLSKVVPPVPLQLQPVVKRQRRQKLQDVSLGIMSFEQCG